MEKQDFFEMTYLEMSRITGKNRQRFSEYNAGKPIGQTALVDCAEKFGISPGTLLDWIIEWRDYDPFDPKVPYGRAYQEKGNNEFLGDEKRFGRKVEPVMSKDVFLGLSRDEMKEMLNISTYRIQTFLDGVKMDEKTIRGLSKAFRLTPGTFLDWFSEWMERQNNKKAVVVIN